jgi:hypothetical protein
MNIARAMHALKPLWRALDRVLVRPAFDLAVRVRRRDLRSRAHQWVQSARRAGAGAVELCRAWAWVMKVATG